MQEDGSTKTRRSPKRDLLLDTAFRLFYLHGYHAVGIDTILAEAGVAKMTLYHHFKSKDDLIVAALERRNTEIQELRTLSLSKADPDPLSKIAALFDAYDAWFHSANFNGCAFIRAIGEYPDEASKVNQTVKRAKSVLFEVLLQLSTELEAKDPNALAQQIFLLIEGAIVRAHMFNDPDAAQQAKSAAIILAKNA